MDPLTTASLISTGGSFLGGLFRGNDGPSPKEQMNHQINLQRTLWLDQLPMMVRGAKKAGLHPLVAAGVNPASGGSFSYGGSDGDSAGQFLADAGQGISRAVEAYSTREERALQRTGMALDLENKRLHNTRLASEIRLMQTGSTNPPGMTPGMIPRNIHAVDPDGRAVRVLNPEAGDNEFLMMADFLSRTLPDELRHMTGRTKAEFKKMFRVPDLISRLNRASRRQANPWKGR